MMFYNFKRKLKNMWTGTTILEFKKSWTICHQFSLDFVTLKLDNTIQFIYIEYVKESDYNNFKEREINIYLDDQKVEKEIFERNSKNLEKYVCKYDSKFCKYISKM